MFIKPAENSVFTYVGADLDPVVIYRALFLEIK